MAADGADAARFECVPGVVAGFVEIFGIIAVGAKPAARFLRLPLAQRTANAAEIDFVSLFFSRFFKDFFGQGSFL